MELNPESDLVVNATDLNSEFRSFSLLFYRYCLQKADVEKKRDLAKARLEELKAVTYKRVKMNVAVKHTEKSVEAEIDTDPMVLEAERRFIEAEHEAKTVGSAVESMRAKKDCLIQLGADARKER